MELAKFVARRSALYPSLVLALLALQLPSVAGAAPEPPRVPSCSTGMVRASGPPDSNLFAKAASRGVRAHWCERYDKWGNATKSGPYREFYAEGALRARATYVASKLAGPVVVYHESGDLFMRGFLENGQWTGPFEIFHENGAAWFKATMQQGRLVGPVVTFFPDGGLESETRFQAGREDGMARSFYPVTAGGQLRSETRVEADALVGMHRIFDRLGSLTRLIDWDSAPIDWSRAATDLRAAKARTFARPASPPAGLAPSREAPPEKVRDKTREKLSRIRLDSGIDANAD